MTRLILVLALLALAAPAWAQGTEESRCEQGQRQACTAAIDAGRYSGEALAGIYAERGEADAQAGHHRAAVGDFTAAITADPRDALYLVFRAKEYEADGQTRLAIDDLKAALALSPGDGEAGSALARLGSTPVAEPQTAGDTLTARIVADPRAEYEPAKAAFAAMLEAKDVGVTNDVAHCVSGADFLGVAQLAPGAGDVNWRFPLYVDLAYDIAAWRLQLTLARYPEAVWAPLLDGYEQAKLLDILVRTTPPETDVDADAPPDDAQDGGGDSGGDADDRAFEARLLKALEAYRAAHPTPRLLRFIRGAGCSGDAPPARVDAKPGDGVVWFIPMFYYELCRANGLAPDDPDSCDRWRELRDGVIADVAGDYAYEVRWPDGAALKGALRVAGGDSITLAEPDQADQTARGSE